MLISLCSKSYPSKDNQRSRYKDDIFCDVCRLFPCTQEHILVCPKLNSMIPQDKVEYFENPVEYTWIYSDQVEKQLLVTKSYKMLEDLKLLFLSQTRSQGTGGEGQEVTS